MLRINKLVQTSSEPMCKINPYYFLPLNMFAIKAPLYKYQPHKGVLIYNRGALYIHQGIMQKMMNVNIILIISV